MIRSAWSHFFKNYNEAMIFIVELEYERRGNYEEPYVWDGIIEKMNQLDKTDYPDSKKIHLLMTAVSRQLLLPTDVFPKAWLLKKIPEVKDMINYYKNNPEEKR